MTPLSDIEYDILGALYFVEPFEKILEEVHARESIVIDALRILIDRKLVTPMRWSDKDNAYVRSFIYDADDMHAFYYLATREGLNLHNTR